MTALAPSPLGPRLRHWACTALALLCWCCTAQAAPMPVVASFSILGQLATEIGGPQVQVQTLVGPDQDAHAYQVTPRDAQKVKQAQVVLVNGLGFDGWLEKLAHSSGAGARVRVASLGLQPQRLNAEGKTIVDPHIWHDLQQMPQYVHNISLALSQADPAHASLYQQREQRWIQAWQQLQQWAQQEVGRIPVAERKIITTHDAFGYLGLRLGIQFLAAQGMSTEQDAGAQQVAQLIRQIRRERIRAVFVENISNNSLLAQLAQEAGVRPGPPLYSDALSGPQGPAPDLPRMMRYNIETMIQGLRQNHGARP